MAAGADVLPDAIGGDFGHEVPAPGALVAAGGKGGDGEGHVRCTADDANVGDVDYLFQARGVALQKNEEFAGCGDFDISFQAFANALGLACFFEHAKSFVANGEDLFPFVEDGRGIGGEDCFGFWEKREVDAGFATAGWREGTPRLRRL